MDEWKSYIGKKVFIILNSNRQYSGIVKSIDDSKTPLIWLTLLDKYGKQITFSQTEIKLIQEEN